MNIHKKLKKIGKNLQEVAMEVEMSVTFRPQQFKKIIPIMENVSSTTNTIKKVLRDYGISKTLITRYDRMLREINSFKKEFYSKLSLIQRKDSNVVEYLESDDIHRIIRLQKQQPFDIDVADYFDEDIESGPSEDLEHVLELNARIFNDLQNVEKQLRKYIRDTK